MGYEHRQRGGLHYVLLGAVAVMLAGAWLGREQTLAVWILLATSGLLLLLSLMFATLTVRDEGQWLALGYGPLPGFRKRIRYADITAMEPSRSSIIDGWGIHCLPGRGWTYNLWGFDCVKLTVARQTVRVGTDDVEGLLLFLRGKLAEQPSPG